VVCEAAYRLGVEPGALADYHWGILLGVRLLFGGRYHGSQEADKTQAAAEAKAKAGDALVAAGCHQGRLDNSAEGQAQVVAMGSSNVET
jgi:hypothetical protein